VTRGDITLEESKANLDKMVQALRQQNPKVDIILQTMNPAWDAPKTAPKKSASDRPNLEAYYEVYRSYAREHSLPLLDHYATWQAMQKDQPEKFQKVVPDGIHPNHSASLWVTGQGVKGLLKKARDAAISKSSNEVKK
jgi:lysophospholipase L1-like esterase